MSTTPHQIRGSNLTPLRGFVSIFLSVFLLIEVGSLLVTFLMPRMFVGVARVLWSDAKAVEVFQSQPVLAAACKALDLPTSLAESYGGSNALSLEQSVDILRRNVQVRRLGSTGVVEIRGYSRSPSEAARLSNAVAEAGIDHLRQSQSSEQSTGPRLVEKAVPANKPDRPNVVLNLALGAIVGALLGVMAGGVGARLAVGYDREGSASR
jgi:uncharacterized protein involved in exopolysaccharide biosynthesis